MFKSLILSTSLLLAVGQVTSPTLVDAAEQPSLDDLLAQLDQIEQASEIAVHSRVQADQLALNDSLQAGGGGSDRAIVRTPVAAIPAEPVSPMVPKVGSGGLVTAQAANPRERMEEVLSGLELPIGGGLVALPSGEQIYVAVSPATPVGIAPGRPGYVRSRQIAYNKADLTARSQMIEFIGMEMAHKRAVDQGITEFTASEEVNLADASKRLADQIADDQLDAELKALGVKTHDAKELTSAEKRAVLRDTYTQTFGNKAAAQLIGASTLAVTEGPIDGQQMMVVATISSPALQRMAGMALDKRFEGRVLPEGSKASALKRLPLENDLQLARQFGAQMISGGKGNQFIVGYGQAEVRNPRMLTIAQQQAVANARQAIIAFVNESVSSEFSQKITESIVGHTDGSQTTSQTIDALASMRGQAELDLQGLETITTRTVQIDGSDSIIAVCLWSPFARQAAVKLEELVSEPVDTDTTTPSVPAVETAPIEQVKPGSAGNSTTSDF